jgi:UDP-3-O-[3-hydroxymyristoyl] glucosamine N-acyltransferase
VADTVYVGPDAQVYENARVYGYAQVFENARVYGNALVFENARVFENAQVFGDAWVYENARVYGNAQVFGNARVYGDAACTKTPCVIAGLLPYIITITDKHISIGCVQVEISKALKMKRREIEALHPEAKTYAKKVLAQLKTYLIK